MPIQLKPILFNPKKSKQSPETHGVYCFVGPPASGKTLLAVWMARQYTTGTAKRNLGYCPCGDHECKEKWICYSNLESTWKTKANPKGWSQPLDVAGAIMDKDQDLGHSIIILDEAYLFGMDSRRSQRTINLDAGYFVSQRRKLSSSTVKMYMTSQSIDMIDSRVRQMTSRIYNCWSPDSGIRVYASITLSAMGHLPPWERNKPPVNKIFYTANSRQFYNQHELVDAEELMARGVKPRIIAIRPNGEKVVVNMEEAIEDQFFKLISSSDLTQLSSAHLKDLVEKEFSGMEISEKLVRNWLDNAGYMRSKDSTHDDVLYNVQTTLKETVEI